MLQAHVVQVNIMTERMPASPSESDGCWKCHGNDPNNTGNLYGHAHTYVHSRGYCHGDAISPNSHDCHYGTIIHDDNVWVFAVPMNVRISIH